ncbi:pilus assembly protein PilX [Variovorax paradoxus]|nr:pilus assembly protein PilX [Variovorax paradoxus]
MSMQITTRRGTPRRRNQHGISLLFALMALVAVSLAAIALVRSVDTGTLILGNLGFKQSTTSAADKAAEAAITWLSAQGSSGLQNDASASGYYATSLEGLDVTGSQSTSAARAIVNWDIDGCGYAASGSYATCTARPSNAITVNGATARYLITRLCLTPGAPAATGNSCMAPLTTSSTSTANRGSLSYGMPAPLSTSSSGPYYRIVVRAVGPRNTVSFIETVVHF